MNKQITEFSDIPRDIWFEIFAYFYVDELFFTFINVLNEINSILLNDIHLRLHIRINDELSTNILSKLHPSQIISLSIEETENNHIDISQMIYLQSITIKGTNADRWIEHLCQQMSLLNQIKYLSISLFYTNRGPYIFDLILNIPHLQKLAFNDLSNWEINSSRIPIIQRKMSSIEKLHLNFYCQFEYLTKLLFYLPNIKNLRLKLLRGNEKSNENFSEYLFNYLTKLHLTICDVSFDKIILFLQTMPNLSNIILDGNVWGTNIISYFKTEKWFEILSFLKKNIKHKKIHVDLDLRQDYSNLSANNIGFIDYEQFNNIGLQLTTYTIKGLIEL